MAHRIPENREEALLLGKTLAKWLPRTAAVLAAPYCRSAAGTGACHAFKGHDVDGVGIVGMGDDRQSEVGGKPVSDRSPSVPIVITAQDTDSRVVRAAAVILHVESPGSIRMACDLVNALAEFGIRVG